MERGYIRAVETILEASGSRERQARILWARCTKVPHIAQASPDKKTCRGILSRTATWDCQAFDHETEHRLGKMGNLVIKLNGIEKNFSSRLRPFAVQCLC